MRNYLSLLVIIISLFTLSAFAADEEENKFTLSTTAFLDENAIPVLYTCDGKDISPEISWTNPPAKANSFAMLMTDPQAPGGTFYHWLLYNIPKSEKLLAEGMEKPPAGATLGKNSFNNLKYNGPCPPKGSAHTYVFTLYALDGKLSVPAGADGKAIVDAMQKHIVGEAKLTAVYSRWLQ